MGIKARLLSVPHTGTRFVHDVLERSGLVYQQDWQQVHFSGGSTHRIIYEETCPAIIPLRDKGEVIKSWASRNRRDPDFDKTWGEMEQSLYFNNPAAYVPNLHGDHLAWLRDRVFIQLVVGSGQWEEHPTQALPSTWALAHALWDKGIPCELDVWGTDTPHDWPSWQQMAVKHLAQP